MTRLRTIQLTALVGALAAAGVVYVYVGGLAGGLFAAAALIFGLFAHLRLKPAEDEEPDGPEPTWNRWGRSRARIADLEQELAAEQARAAELDTHVEVLRRELAEQRHLAQALEHGFRQRLAELEGAHEAGVGRVVAGLAELEQELEQLTGAVEALAAGAGEESSHEGAIFQHN